MLASAPVFFLTVSPVAADPLSPPTAAQIVVKIDKDRYNLGDIVVISGQVQSIVTDMQLTIQILDPNNNLVHIEQIPVTSDGQFSLPVKVYGPLWSVPGKYSIVVQYGFKHISAIVNFQFEQVDVPTQNVFNVKDLSSGQNFDLNYTITGGQVESMALDKQDIALVVQINSTDSGMLHLQIPRLLLDSKKPSNADESFLVFINGDEITSFQQTSSDYNYRVLDIPIVTGDSKIEIIGTTVIPEFENISSLILVLAVGLVTIFSVLLQTRTSQKLLNL
ncbi:MAG TPA: PEFG-CTERM sorting domain-containing protein [Candidatus Nitrosotalea sp.]|nr:PEFG-CTERM sorting domain-containing protein [Candidatus Nitrosotalea sp.]